MEKVFSPADEEGHSVSSSSPSTHRLIPLHQRHFLLCAFCGPVFWTPPPPITLLHAASDVCTQHALLGNLRAQELQLCMCAVAVHMLSACGTRTDPNEAEWVWSSATGVGFQPWSVFIDQTLTGALTLTLETAGKQWCFWLQVYMGNMQHYLRCSFRLSASLLPCCSFFYLNEIDFNILHKDFENNLQAGLRFVEINILISFYIEKVWFVTETLHNIVLNL